MFLSKNVLGCPRSMAAVLVLLVAVAVACGDGDEADTSSSVVPTSSSSVPSSSELPVMGGTDEEMAAIEAMYRACRAASTAEECASVEGVRYRFDNEVSVDGCSWYLVRAVAPLEECWTDHGFCTVRFSDESEDEHHYHWDGQRLLRLPDSSHISPFPPTSEEEATRPEQSEWLRMKETIARGEECE